MEICKHFGECGGCRFQDIPYSEQLKNKEQKLRDLCAQYQLDTELKPIHFFREQFYRNKMEFTFSQDEQGRLVCGMHKKEKKRQVFDLKECLIFSPHAGELVQAVVSLFQGKNTAFNTYSHIGFLRHLIVRETKITGEIMVGLVTTTQEKFSSQELVDCLKALPFADKIKSVFWITNDNHGDAVTFEEKHLLYGESFISEQVHEYTFRIFIDSFFQTNVHGIRALYQAIRDYAGLTGTEKVLDLFCGVGSIGLFLAPQARFVWGVELKKEIVANAGVNAELNQIKNISFICEDTRKFLNSRSISDMDLVIINPPRSGLSKKIKRRLLQDLPETMFYSSCNPASLCSDLKDFSSAYKIVFLEPFDFFPHTPHMECLALLQRKGFSLDKEGKIA